jgi:hypothetical protein
MGSGTHEHEECDPYFLATQETDSWGDSGECHAKGHRKRRKSGGVSISELLETLAESQWKSLLERWDLDVVPEKIGELEKRIDQRPGTSTFTLVSSLGIPGYTIQKSIPVTIRQDGDEFTATFFDANISTGGDTEQEAVANLQTLIADFYDELAATPDKQLGPSLQRQKFVLGEFVCRT